MPISTGLNADVIADGVGSVISSTTIDIDGVNYNYVAVGFQATASATPITYGVPANGFIASAVGSTPGLTYQLAPLTGNNSLRLPTTAPTGTITFATPLAVNTLYMLAVTGSGAGTVTAVVNFSDATSQTFTGVAVADWFGGSNYAIQGIGRVNRTTNALEPNTTNPRMYQIPLAISTANQSKPIQSVQITKTSTGGEVVNVFAFSADAYTSCPAPTAITYTSTMDGAVINWTAPSIVPSDGYDYYISTSATAPTATTTPTGNVAAGTNTKTLTGLLPGQTYYCWIRSNCGGVKGFWQTGTFTPGQITYTYTGGEINTLYEDSSTVSTNSTTTCPGVMTVSVPPGYKIASVGTSYIMTTASNGWMSEQRSLLVCNTTGLKEASLSAGSGNGGTFNYNRSGIAIANDLTGSVEFELRAWRTFGGSGCNNTYNKVDNNTWKVIVTYALDSCTTPDAPTGAAQNLCPTATFADLSADGIVGAVYNWYADPTGGEAIDPATPIAVGTYYVSQTVGTCESPRSAAIAVTLDPTPLPTAVAQTLCGGTVISDLETTSGENIQWYTALTGGTALAATTALETGNYYVSQTVNGCESARATVAVTINTTPAPVAASQIFCAGEGSTVADIQVTTEEDTTVQWYASATATETLDTATVLGTGTYYVSQSLGDCESVRVAVNIAVSTIVAPTTFPQELCSGATVADLEAGGSPVATYKWYASESDDEQLAEDMAVTSGTYYVTQTLGTCESSRAAVEVTINNVTAPEAADQEFCNGATAADLTATASEGATIKWYASEDSATALGADTALETGIYYVSQKLNDCESDRVPVQVNVNAVIDAPIAANQAVCMGATVADLSIELSEGATANWYASETATTPLSSEEVLSEGTYYVSQNISICESERVAVEVTHTIVPVPTAENFVVCSGTMFSELTVEGEEGADFNWYTTLDGSTLVDLEGEVSAGTFYVSQTVNGCEGGRLAVNVALTTTAMPTPFAVQSFCGEAFVSDLTAGETETYTVNWYSPEGNLVSSTDALVSGTYTVSQSFEGCESQVVEVEVVVSAIPDMPVGDAEQEFEEGATVADLDVEFVADAIVEWFVLDEDAWISIPAATPLISGNTYGASQSIGACSSEILAIEATVLLGTESFELKNVVVYPNPATDVLTVEGKDTLTEISVVNLLGQQVMRQSVNANTVQVNVSSLPQATYILQVNAANGATASFKIVKQ
ncbi:T9SS type A sorting domain-containing protein [Flavobacterium sp. NRK1]|uniref:Ig-like domain-containing protein n=1 Tax=Flavobacterium sp. NRK1 TaxID=2954929 RepID=UPI0020934B83|nr:T9SS type A sorting domain-containing protein [Flavobacterium sp. NRK1]MCO6148611.1 T9SS type A sorting domain-containing protein [Flavobacterium sp. NRK1]